MLWHSIPSELWGLVSQPAGESLLGLCDMITVMMLFEMHLECE
jgi:hypothetical protein